MRRLAAVRGALVVCWLGLGVAAQEPARIPHDVHPIFEVATIRPSDPADQSQGFHTMGRQVYIERETVQTMMMMAYDVHASQLANVPEWVTKEPYDIRGVPDTAGMPDVKQLQEMVRMLLKQRFNLKFHEEVRELPVYALRVSKGGPKMAKTASAPDALEDQTGNGHAMRYTANTMEDFVRDLVSMVDRPVVDQTGLKDRYDFTLRWSPEGAPREDADAAQPLFSAMPEQLGLKLEAAKASIKVLVVDRMERPTAN